MSRSLKILITLSVLLNLLLAGLVIGHVGRYFWGSRMHQSLQEMAQSLPADKRAHFEETLRATQKDTDALREQVVDARKKATKMLKADSFDKAAYLAQVQEIQKLHDKIMQRMAETVADLAEQATPDERSALADSLRRPPHPPGND